MTVIIWDGKTMVGDKLNYGAGSVSKVTKIRKINGNLVGCTGKTTIVGEIWTWAENDFSLEYMPVSQKDPETSCIVMCVTPKKEILIYENFYKPWLNEELFCAIGSGADTATGALAAGATAIEAVAICERYTVLCGNGYDILTLD